MWERLGLALLHFVWQGVLVAALVAVLAAWLPRGRGRYAAYLLGMAAMLACLPATFVFVRADAAPFAVSAPIAANTPVTEVAPDHAANVVWGEDSPIAAQAQRIIQSPNVLIAAVWVWLLGAGMLSLRLPLAWLAVRRLRRDAEPVAPTLRDRAASLAARLGLRKRVDVFASRHVVQPVVTGCLWPVILLPVALLSEMSLPMLEAVIAHELAHVRRRDIWVMYGQRLAETLLFYHPAVWWLSSRLSAEREICCDQQAVAVTGGRMDYATALERAAARALLSAPSASLAFGGRAGGRATTLERVRNVLGVAPARPALGWASGAAALAVLATLFALGCGLARSRAGDDRVADASKPPRAGDTRPRVLLVTTGDFFLEKATAASADFATDVVTPQKYDAKGAASYHMVMFHGWQPAALPPVNTTFWNVIPPALAPRGAPDASAEWNKSLTEETPDHLLVRGLDLNPVVVTKVRRMAVPPAATVIAAAGDTPAIVMYTPSPGRTNVVVGFDTADSSWPPKASFPVFVHRTMELLTGRAPSIASTKPATRLENPAATTQKVARLIFRPKGRGESSTWTSPIPDRTAGPGRAFIIVGAALGGPFPVRTRHDGPVAFEAKVIEGDEHYLRLEIDDGKAPPHRVTVNLDQPERVEIAGQPFTFSYGTTTIAAEETQYSERANLFIHFNSPDAAQR
jgi:beta-lactamase regulating signal transducer with metallopeptidase domain